jgi:hypothetical protein
MKQRYCSNKIRGQFGREELPVTVLLDSDRLRFFSFQGTWIRGPWSVAFGAQKAKRYGNAETFTLVHQSSEPQNSTTL